MVLGVVVAVEVALPFVAEWAFVVVVVVVVVVAAAVAAAVAVVASVAFAAF